MNHKSVGVFVVAFLLVTACGCSQDVGDAEAQAGGAKSPAPAASPLDPRLKALGDAQAKGREEDAKRTAAAMQKSGVQ